MRDEVLKKALESKGSAKRLADALGITEQAVSQWSRVPASRVIEFERETGISRQRVRPDLYPPEQPEAVE